MIQSQRPRLPPQSVIETVTKPLPTPSPPLPPAAILALPSARFGTLRTGIDRIATANQPCALSRRLALPSQNFRILNWPSIPEKGAPHYWWYCSRTHPRRPCRVTSKNFWAWRRRSSLLQGCSLRSPPHILQERLTIHTLAIKKKFIHTKCAAKVDQVARFLRTGRL